MIFFKEKKKRKKNREKTDKGAVESETAQNALCLQMPLPACVPSTHLYPEIHSQPTSLLPTSEPCGWEDLCLQLRS